MSRLHQETTNGISQDAARTEDSFVWTVHKRLVEALQAAAVVFFPAVSTSFWSFLSHTHALLFYIYIIYVSKCSLYTFYNNPAPLNGSTQFHYCTDSNPGTGADDAFVLKRGLWRNATWPSHSRPAIAASARHFQICFSPLTF